MAFAITSSQSRPSHFSASSFSSILHQSSAPNEACSHHLHNRQLTFLLYVECISKMAPKPSAFASPATPRLDLANTPRLTPTPRSVASVAGGGVAGNIVRSPSVASAAVTPRASVSPGGSPRAAAAGGDEEIFYTGSITHNPGYLTLDPRLSTAEGLVTHANLRLIATNMESFGIALQKIAATRQTQPRVSKAEELTAEEHEHLDEISRDYSEQIKQAVTAQAQEENAKKPPVRLTTTSGEKMTQQAAALKKRLIELAPVNETEDGRKDGDELTVKGLQRHLDAISKDAMSVLFKNAVQEHIPSARTAKASRTESSKPQATPEDTSHLNALDNFQGILHEQYVEFCINNLKHIQPNASTKSHASRFKMFLKQELKADEGEGEGGDEEEFRPPRTHQVVSHVQQLSEAGLQAFWAKCVETIGPKAADEVAAKRASAAAASPSKSAASKTAAPASGGSSKLSLPSHHTFSLLFTFADNACYPHQRSALALTRAVTMAVEMRKRSRIAMISL
jgi:hypothetical protein